MKSKLKICVVLVDRANYGRLFPVMHELKNNQECILQTICSGTMMLEKASKTFAVLRPLLWLALIPRDGPETRRRTRVN